MTETRLSTRWELWVVEQLLFSAQREGIVSALVSHGVPPDEAVGQVARIERDPGFAQLRERLTEAALAIRLDKLGERLAAGPVSVPTRPTLTVEDLYERHWLSSRPVKLTEVGRQIPAVQTWSLRWLAERFAEATVEVNVGRDRAARPSDTERDVARMSVPAFVARALSETTNALYVVSRNGWLADPQFAALWDDLRTVPPLLVAPDPPRGVSMWAGPAGTRTPAHFDPHNVLLVQVEGHKRVRLAPRLRARHHLLLDGYYLDGTLRDRFGEAAVDVELDPGEALFVPAGWYHEVEALSPSITLSFVSFPWPNHFHFLGPTGSDDR
ncbi:MAG: cupin-like domain-containing protein [Myxococcota bacterium]